MNSLKANSLEFAYFLATHTNQGKARQLIEQVSATDANAEDFLRSFASDIPVPTSDQIDKITSDLLKHEKSGIAIVPISSRKYPDRLRAIADAPPILYAKGNLELLNESQNLAVVGTRDASSAGREIARRIAMFFAAKKWCIVSGLALGIDTAAHEGALDASGSTIAVLAHGLHTVAPPSNRGLAERILDRGGLWVSEYSSGAPPRAHQFKLRNRIQTGLSIGSIIVEGKERSGSMAQARYCLDQERELFAVVPSSPANPLGLICDGTVALVKSGGATAIQGKEDYTGVEQRLEKASRRMSQRENSTH